MESIQLNTVSAVDAVCTALEGDILSMRFLPGSKITENDLSSRYGVSRNTVREAVAYLLSQGILTKIANKGVYVRRFTSDDVVELFHLRSLLEQEAIRICVKNKTSPCHLVSLVEQMEGMSRADQWEEYVRCDIRFHAELVAAAGSPRLSKLYDTIITEVKLCIYQTRNYVSLPSSNSPSHRLILDAVCNADAAAAAKLMLEHIEHVVKRYCAGLLAMSQDE